MVAVAPAGVRMERRCCGSFVALGDRVEGRMRGWSGGRRRGGVVVVVVGLDRVGSGALVRVWRVTLGTLVVWVDGCGLVRCDFGAGETAPSSVPFFFHLT
jgi:hypothetical protein